jgi:hypothetical protein
MTDELPPAMAPCNATVLVECGNCYETHVCDQPEGHEPPHECECGKEWSEDECLPR